MAALYPAIEPYASGMLEVGDGHRLYWETCGRPDGRPAVVLHGGPGSGCAAAARRYFDPGLYRVVQFDQRGCGRSTPHAGDPTTDLAGNTIHHLLADIERLRGHLGIERWLVLGGSWGATLALAYAEWQPHRVTGVVLRSVTMTSRWEIEWITRGVRIMLPEAWARFQGGVPPADREGDLVDAYHRLLASPDPGVRVEAARRWCGWEAAVVALHPGQAPSLRYEDPAFRYAFARLVTHYWHHAAWLEDGALLRDAQRLAGIPAILVHGRLDLGSPPVTAWRLAQAWPGSALVLVSGAGHDTRDPGMREAVIAAIDDLAGRR